MKFDSLDFYREHASRYSNLSHEFTHSLYTDSSLTGLAGDMDLLKRIVKLAPGRRGLDAGCGAGARDVHLLNAWGYQAYGVDAVEENVSLAKSLHPEIADLIQVVDLREPLPFADASFDFVTCNAVIQHMAPQTTEQTTLPELARVLAPDGVLQLMFKVGSGVVTVGDKAYGSQSVARTFQLYSEYRLLEVLKELGCTLVEPSGKEELGGLMYFNDIKPMRHCVFWVRKSDSWSGSTRPTTTGAGRAKR